MCLVFTPHICRVVSNQGAISVSCGTDGARDVVDSARGRIGQIRDYFGKIVLWHGAGSRHSAVTLGCDVGVTTLVVFRLRKAVSIWLKRFCYKILFPSSE